MRFVFFLSFLSAELTAATEKLSCLPLLCSLADDGSRAQNVFAHLHRHCEADSKKYSVETQKPILVTCKNTMWTVIHKRRIPTKQIAFARCLSVSQ